MKTIDAVVISFICFSSLMIGFIAQSCRYFYPGKAFGIGNVTGVEKRCIPARNITHSGRLTSSIFGKDGWHWDASYDNLLPIEKKQKGARGFNYSEYI